MNMRYATLALSFAVSSRAQDVNLVPGVEDIHIATESFKKRDCAVVEGSLGNKECEMPTDYKGLKSRTLLKFSTLVWNKGPDDLTVNRNDSPPEWFEWGDCHRHWHFKDFTKYELLDTSGTVVSGRKQAFCLMDIQRMDPNAGSRQYSCSNQGITAGWADVYRYTLDGQWIDITGVPAGSYTLKVTINAGQNILETDLEDNSVSKVLPPDMIRGTSCEGGGDGGTGGPTDPGTCTAVDADDRGCTKSEQCCTGICLHQQSTETKTVEADIRFLRAMGGRKLETCENGNGGPCDGICICRAKNDPCTSNIECCSSNCKHSSCKGN